MHFQSKILLSMFETKSNLTQKITTSLQEAWYNTSQHTVSTKLSLVEPPIFETQSSKAGISNTYSNHLGHFSPSNCLHLELMLTQPRKSPLHYRKHDTTRAKNAASMQLSLVEPFIPLTLLTAQWSRETHTQNILGHRRKPRLYIHHWVSFCINQRTTAALEGFRKRTTAKSTC